MTSNGQNQNLYSPMFGLITIYLIYLFIGFDNMMQEKQLEL
jgi:hypothetical protein